MTDPRDTKREALEDALRDYMAACGDGAYLTDWVIFAAGASPSGTDTQYGFWASRHTPIHSLRGLVDMGQEEICDNSVTLPTDADDD